MIVDNEKIIRETIHSLIDWHSIGIEVVGLCKNGIEAYDMILDEYPDIVMTDIKMPGLSGIDLIKRVSQLDRDIEFIILSGYGEFQFAQDAMKYGIRHYLLKPCNEQQIISVLEECKKECLHKKAIESIIEDQNDLNENFHQTIIKNLLISSLLNDDSEEKELSLHTYKQLIDMDSKSYELCYFYYVEEKNKEAALEQVYDFFDAAGITSGAFIVYVPYTLLIFFESSSSIAPKMDHIKNKIYFESQSVSVEYRRKSFSNLKMLLQVLIKELRLYDMIYICDDKARLTPIRNYHYFIKQIEKIIHKIQHHFYKTPEEIIEAIGKLLYAITDFNFFRMLIVETLMRIKDLGQSAINQVHLAEFLLDINQLNDKDILLKKTQKYIETLLSPTDEQTKNKDFIEKLKHYVEVNLSSQNLSLKWLAENYLFMNVDYVSKQFMKQTGQKFSAYLTNIRIEKAKKLLINAELENIADIAEQVGCGNNPQYFSQVFKKHTGITPTAYIKLMKGEN